MPKSVPSLPSSLADIDDLPDAPSMGFEPGWALPRSQELPGAPKLPKSEVARKAKGEVWTHPVRPHTKLSKIARETMPVFTYSHQGLVAARRRRGQGVTDEHTLRANHAMVRYFREHALRAPEMPPGLENYRDFRDPLPGSYAKAGVTLTPGWVYLYRGVSQDLTHKRVGHKFKQPSFSSWSRDPATAWAFAESGHVLRLKIGDIPAGTPWAFFEHHAQPRDARHGKLWSRFREYETLLPPGTFVITRKNAAAWGLDPIHDVRFEPDTEAASLAGGLPVYGAAALRVARRRRLRERRAALAPGQREEHEAWLRAVRAAQEAFAHAASSARVRAWQLAPGVELRAGHNAVKLQDEDEDYVLVTGRGDVRASGKYRKPGNRWRQAVLHGLAAAFPDAVVRVKK